MLLPGSKVKAKMGPLEAHTKATHCVKSVRFWIFSGPYFPEKISPNEGKYGPEKLRIRTLFTQ